MFKLDENFLDSIGLGGMSEEQKRPFLKHIYQELELRVGKKLSDGMSDEQLNEFGSIIDRNEAKILTWLNNNVPNYVNDSTFLALQERTGLSADNLNLLAEYTSSKWLEINRPNYREVVENTMTELKNEIISNKDTLLS